MCLGWLSLSGPAAAGPDSTRLSSHSIRSVARGSMGLNPADPLMRQNEEVLQVGTGS